MALKPLEWPEPCAGEHDPQAHDHSWAAAVALEYRGKRKCSERFRCVKCWRWYPGEACKPARPVAAA